MIAKARDFAFQQHRGQMYGQKPYSYHLQKVAQYAAPYGEKAIVLAYLHDVVEDTDTTLAEIEREFDPFIASCISILTDEKGENRKERKRKTYAKMAKIHKNDSKNLALIVKVADRLANLEECLAENNRRLIEIYLNEHEIFRKSVYRQDLCEPLWEKVENIIKLLKES